jgi:hypothetical protein
MNIGCILFAFEALRACTLMITRRQRFDGHPQPDAAAAGVTHPAHIGLFSKFSGTKSDLGQSHL